MKALDLALSYMNIHYDLLKHGLFNYELYDFDQTWGSTALGFSSGVGGSQMTTARTTVIVPNDKHLKPRVYFNGTLAYSCGANKKFWEDVSAGNMASVNASSKYSMEEGDTTHCKN